MAAITNMDKSPSEKLQNVSEEQLVRVVAALMDAREIYSSPIILSRIRVLSTDQSRSSLIGSGRLDAKRERRVRFLHLQFSSWISREIRCGMGVGF
jgi:hypothetical protein